MIYTAGMAKNVTLNRAQSATPLKDGTADYRLRVGDYRIFLNVLIRVKVEKIRKGLKVVEEKTEIPTIIILDVARRTGTTYKKR